MNKNKDIPDSIDPNRKQNAEPKAAKPTAPGSGQTESGAGAAPVSPAIELPKGGGAIRGMGEKFSANPVTGTASFSVPLPVSPGRAGFQPQISLSYNSGAGNSPFGMGWNVEIASITRKTSKGLPHYTSNDVFVLAGAEDLVPVLDGNGEIYERHETNFLVQRYHPRVEGLYSRIERWEEKTTGISHWRVTDKSNIVSVFGESKQARTFHPDDDAKVFEWMIEKRYDSLGNIILFEYKRENNQNINPNQIWEGNRLAHGKAFNRLYPKKVFYGNTIMFGGPAFDTDNDWHFQLVFDYGEHDPQNPSPTEENPWPVRQDPFSTYNTRFELRTYRLCQRVLLFHKFSGENGGNPFLVRTLKLYYNENPIATQLTSALQRGHRDGQEESIPLLKFSYTQALVNPMVQKLDPEDLKNLPMGVDGNNYRWIDLYGEGISGVLAESGNAWFYKPNNGNENYYKDHPADEKPKPVPDLAPTQLISHRPVPGNINALQDINGDGKPEMVLRQPGLTGIFEFEVTSPNGYFQPFKGSPNLDWNSPDVRFVDLTGDGLADILITEQDEIQWLEYHNHPPGYAKAQKIANVLDEEKGPRVVFSNDLENIFLADMSGDGLSDLLRIQNGAVCYWPNLGYGQFGAKVNMGNLTHLDRKGFFDGSRIRLGDTDGSGTTDIIYLGSEKTTYHLNQAGNSFAPPVELEFFPTMDNLDSVTLTDLFGNGTTCLVWSSSGERAKPFQMRYIDLTGQKPYLLEETDNGMGALRKFSYAPSTKFYLRDRRNGKPWATKLPFPVQTLERVETYEQITGNRFVSRYAYRHGYFDPIEREFRGFGMVEQWDSETYQAFNRPALYQVGINALEEESHSPPSYTKTWFHTGYYGQAQTIEEAYQEEYWQGDSQAWRLPSVTFSPEQYHLWSPQELREAHRALKGSMLRQEVFSLTLEGAIGPVPYQVVENGYYTKMLQGKGPNHHAVFRTFQRESLAYDYERDASDPRIGHQLTLETDQYGNVLQAAQIGYPRRAPSGSPQAGVFPEQEHSYISVGEAQFINKDDSPDFYRVSAPVEQKQWEFSAATPPISQNGLPPWRPGALQTAINGAAIVPPQHNFSGNGNIKQLQGQSRTTYYSQDLSSELPPGQIAPNGLPYRTYQLAFTDGLINAIYNDTATQIDLNTNPNPMSESGYLKTGSDWWAPSPRAVHDDAAFYLPMEQHDPFGGVSLMTYDNYDILVDTTQDPIGNQTFVENDYITLQPQQITDPNGNRQAVKFDALDRVTALAVMGKAPADPDYPGYEEGDSLTVPGTTFSYDVHAFGQSGLPASITITKRETHIHSPNPNNETLKEVSYYDGLGNELQRRVQFDAANGVAVTGRQIVNNKGLVVAQYEPYLDTGYAYSENTPPDAAKVQMRYDPLNRLVRTDFDDGTFTKVEFNAWQQKEYDQNDTVMDSQWYIDRGSPAPNAPEPTDPEGRAAWLSAKAYNTPRVLDLDPLGRMFLRRNNNGSDGAPVYYVTRFELDILGRKRKVTDARGLETIFIPSLLSPTKEDPNRSVYENGPDSGKKWMLPDVVGKPVYSWDERGFRQRMEYDVAQRPVGKWVKNGSGNEVLKEKTVFGENATNPRIDNLRGQVFEQHDQAGKITTPSFDFKENPKEEERQFATAYDSMLDYNNNVPLNAEIYTTVYTHDALNRPTEKNTPDDSTCKYTYAKNGLLQSEAVAVRGSGTDSPAITDIKYDAKGQRTDIYYANGSKTKYFYDPATFRVTRILTTRNTGTDILQDLWYIYDAVGNITQMKDDAQQTIYFANQVVPPICKYTYDSLYRLKKATGRELNGLNQPSATDCPIKTPVPATETDACRNYTQNYQYDELGNILQVQHIASGGNWTRNYYYPTTNNKLIGHVSGQTDYTYDQAGNMLSMPHLNSLSWNENNMPIELDLGGGGTAYYRYDSGGNRVRKVIVNGSTKKERLYIGDWELWRQSVSGNVETQRETLNISDDKKRFLQFDTLTVDNGTPISTPITNWRYQYDNHLGSACLELDNTAQVISYEEYFPFGSTSYRSGKSQSEVKLKRYRYCGKERDEESGLYYYGARYYAAWLGRFVSVDLLKNDYPQLTPYNYASNRPITHKDIDGMQTLIEEKVKPTQKPFNEVKIDNTRVVKANIKAFELKVVEPSKSITAGEAARIADNVYGGSDVAELINGWRKAESKMVKLAEQGFIFEDPETGFQSALYERNNAEGITEYVYAFAGTNDLKDAKEDINQALGMDAPQYKQAADNARAISDALPNSNLTFVGHSLGGGLASAAALATGRNAITFNAAGLHSNTIDANKLTIQAQIDAYVVQGEIVDYNQKAFGLTAEGTRHEIKANYVPQIWGTKADDTYRTYQRVNNHLMGTVIQKMRQQRIR